MIKNYLTEIFDFILPRFCPSCRNKLATAEKTVCNSCLSKIKLADPEFIKSEYQRNYESKGIIFGFVSHYIFEKDKELQQIIHALKYDRKFQIGIFLGENLGKHFKSKFKNWNINLIVPIPLHHLRKAERGFNQSYYIAKGISAITAIPVNTKTLKRIRFTQSQTTLGMNEREINVEGAFTIKYKEDIKEKNILLIDDVITTGATTNECGKVLLGSGARQIFAASIATV